MSYIRTPEHREKMRLIKTGQTHSEATRRKISDNHADVSGAKNPMYGSKRSQSVKDAISIANTGKKRPGQVSPMSGKKHSLETRKKMSRAQSGHRGSNWKGGTSEQGRIIRKSLEYRLWREAVFLRDNHTCQLCNTRGGDLQADHIKPFSRYPELRFAIDNGRTLCKTCHKETDTFGFKILYNKEYVN